MAKKFNIASVERVKEVFDYDPDAGKLFRKISCGPRGPVGPVSLKTTQGGYLRAGLDGNLYLVHRLAWVVHFGKWPEEELDHINEIKHDNRLVNLREATSGQNQCNRYIQANNTTGFKGVSRYKEKFGASISIGKETIFLGLRSTPEEAGELYDAAAIKYHGKFAYNMKDSA